MENRIQEVSTTVTARFDASPGAVFDAIIPVDLPDVFDRWGPIPGVERTERTHGTGPWTEVGLRRRVHMTGGGSLEEETVAADRPHHFAYEIENIDLPLRHLVERARGEWTFTTVDGGTLAKWTYTFEPRRFRTPVASLFTHYVFRNYMRNAMGELDYLV